MGRIKNMKLLVFSVVAIVGAMLWNCSSQPEIEAFRQAGAIIDIRPTAGVATIQHRAGRAQSFCS